MSGGLDLASLGVDIDTSDVGEGIVRFQDLVRASQQLEAAIGSLEGRSKTFSRSMEDAGASASRASLGTDKVAGSARSAGAGLDTASAAVSRAAGIYDSLVSSMDGAARAMSGLTSIRTAGNQSLNDEASRLSVVASRNNDVAAAADRAAAAVGRRAAAERNAPAGGGGSGGGGGGGGPSSPPAPPGGGGGGGGPPNLAAIDRLIEAYITKIGQNARTGADREQYTAMRKVGEDPDAPSVEAQGLKELVGLYYELREAAIAAAAAEKARVQQAGVGFRDQLNESLGITRPAGAEEPKRARDSAAVFREAAEQQERIEGLQRSQAGSQFARDLDAQYNGFRNVAGSARDAARAFEEFYAQQEKSDQLRRAGMSQQFGSDLNSQYNNFQPRAQSARDSASVFEEDWRRVQQINAQDSKQFGERVNSVFNNFEGSGGGSARDSARVFEEEAKRVAAAEKEAAAASVQYQRDLDGLKNKLDPTRAAMAMFYREIGLAQEAFDKGDLSMEQYNTALASAEANFKKFNGAVAEGGRQAGLSGQQYFWMLSNIKDFVNQISAGGSLSTALLQQGPMLFQIMGMAEGGVGGAVQGIKRDAGTLLRNALGFGPKATAQPTSDSPGADGVEAVSKAAAEVVADQVGKRVLVGMAGRGAGVVPGAVAAGGAGAVEAAAGVGAVEEAVKGLGARSYLAIGAITGLVVAIGGLYLLGESRRKELERSTFGIGRKNGMTADQLESQAMSGTDAALGISRATSREAVGAMAATGNLNASSMAAVQKILKDYAYTTNQEVVPAAKELAEALDGSSSGMDKLNAKTGFLNAETRELYTNMVASGDRTGATKILVDALSKSLEDAAARTGLFSRAWNLLKSGIANGIDIAATGIDDLVTGGSLEKQLAKARADIAELRRKGVTEEPSAIDIIYGNGGGSQELANALKRAADLEKKISDVAERMRNASEAAKSIKLDDAIKSANPLAEQLKNLQNRLNELRVFKLEMNLPVSQMKDLDLATASTARQLRQMAEDAKYGGTAFAEMVRSAQEGLRTVGFTDFGKKIAEQQFNREAEIRKLDLEGQNAVVADPVKLAAERARIAAMPGSEGAKQAALDRIDADTDNYKRQRAAIDERYNLNREATVRQNSITANQAGGSYSRAPENVRTLIDEAVAKRGNIPQALLSGLVETESTFRPDKFGQNKDGSFTSAYGYTQIMRDAEKDIRKLPGMGSFNRMDPSQNIDGGAAYLQQLVKAFDGDYFKAVAAYHDGETATKNAIARTGQVLPAGADYARKVAKLGGFNYEGGAQSAAGIDARQDDVSRGLRERAQTQRIEAQNPDSQYQQDYQTERLRRYNAELAITGTVSEAATAKIEEAARAVAKLNQEAASTRLGKDLKFELEQMGRTPEDAAAYARVRSSGTDIDTPMGQTLLQQAQYNSSLMQTKAIAQDTWGSISQGILSGASAAEVATSALNKLAAKLMDMAGNEIIAGLFGANNGNNSSQNSGGLGGLLGGLMGGGNGGLSGFFGAGNSSSGSRGGSFGGIGGFIRSLFGGGAGGGGAESFIGEGLMDVDIAFAKGGIMTPRGPVPLRPYAGGGVATGPQMALFGEASQNEAFIPLPDGRTVPVTLDRAGEGSAVGGGAPSFVASITMQGSSGDPRADRDHADNTARTMEATFKQMFDRHVAGESRPGGSLYRGGARRNN